MLREKRVVSKTMQLTEQDERTLFSGLPTRLESLLRDVRAGVCGF